MPELIKHHNQELAEYRGTLYYASTGRSPKDHVTLAQIPGETYPEQGFEYSAYSAKYEKHVPVQDLDAWYLDSMALTWRGQPFDVMDIQDDRVLTAYAGRDGGWAHDNGLEGDHYNGFVNWLNLDEVEDLHVERTDHLARWKKEHGG